MTFTSAEMRQIVAATSRLLDWDWVNRRVETVVLTDAHTLRRSFSIDFTLPDLERDLGIPVTLAELPIPVAMVRKGLLYNFQLRDGAGRSVNLMTAEETRPIRLFLLEALAWAILEERTDTWHSDAYRRRIQHLLSDITGTQAGPGLKAAKALQNLTPPLWSSSFPTEGERAMQKVANDLARNSLLFVRALYSPGQGGVLHLSYEDAFYAYRYRKALRRLLHWRGIEVWLQTGFERSYHAEIYVPPPIVLPTQTIESEVNNRNDDFVVRGNVVYVYIPSQQSSQGGARSVRRLRFHSILLTNPAGLPLTTLLISLAANAVIGIGYLLHRLGLHTVQGGVAASILLSLPALFAAYAARPPEHELVEILSRPFRARIVFAALLSICAAGDLAVTFPHHGVLGGVTAAITWIILLAVSSMLSLERVTSWMVNSRVLHGQSPHQPKITGEG